MYIFNSFMRPYKKESFLYQEKVKYFFWVLILNAAILSLLLVFDLIFNAKSIKVFADVIGISSIIYLLLLKKGHFFGAVYGFIIHQVIFILFHNILADLLYPDDITYFRVLVTILFCLALLWMPISLTLTTPKQFIFLVILGYSLILSHIVVVLSKGYQWQLTIEIMSNILAFITLIFLVTLFGILHNLVHFSALSYSEQSNKKLSKLVDERTKVLEETLKKMNQLAITDSLSGLYNRHYLNEYLPTIQRDDFSVILFDIDHFKKTNDTYGHLIGDKVIKGIAQILLNNTNEEKTYFRYGGEEFLIITKDVSLDNATKFAEQIRKQIETINFNSENNHFSVTCSFGVASMPSPKISANDLLLKADDALYKAKESGRNCVMRAM